MKILFFAFMVVFGAASCSDDLQYKEVVLKRFTGGEKKIVAFYEGRGAKEILVKRLTYDKLGNLILQENLLAGTKYNHQQLQLPPSLRTSNGFRNYLQGAWASEGVINRGEYTEKNEKQIIRVQGTDFFMHSVGKYKNFGEGWDTKISATINYENDFVYSFSAIKADGEPYEPEKTDNKNEQLKIESMNTFYFEGVLFKKEVK